MVRTIGRITFINIFGSLTGDIGGESTFPTPTPEPLVEQQQSDGGDDGAPAQKDIGGQLGVELSNNVNDYVLPGDTVTFFATINNPGGGRVYDTKLYIGLYKDGVDTGGIEYKIGTVKGFGTAKLTTGIVLSKAALGGHYTARAIISGVVGPDDHEVSATSDAPFNIFGKIIQMAEGIIPEVNAQGAGEVLAAADSTTQNGPGLEEKMRELLLVSLMAIFVLQGYRKRKGIALAINHIKTALIMRNK
jgi:hypothetical protein